MIAQRFRSLGWVASIATAATGLYLVSLQVATERGKLEAVERRIGVAHSDIRQLQTELGTRASLRQLEQWNIDVLALSAPKAVQYMRSGTQLASLMDNTVPAGMGAAPQVRLASAQGEQTATAPVALLQRTVYVKPVEAPRAERVSVRKPTVEIKRAALIAAAKVKEAKAQRVAAADAAKSKVKVERAAAFAAKADSKAVRRAIAAAVKTEAKAQRIAAAAAKADAKADRRAIAAAVKAAAKAERLAAATAKSKPERVAMVAPKARPQRTAMLGSSLMNDIARTAAKERRNRP